MKKVKLKNYSEFVILDDDIYKKIKNYYLFYKVEKKLQKSYAYISVVMPCRKIKSLYKFIFGDIGNKGYNHLNGNKFDFRKENIAIISYSCSRQLSKESITKYIGIKKIKDDKYEMLVTNMSKEYRMRFSTEIEAAIAYNLIIKSFHGEFANINKIDEEAYKQDFERIEKLINLDLQNRKSVRGQGIKKSKKATSSYIGVYFKKDRNKWSARIRKNMKTYNLGSYINEKDAAIAYDKKALELYGEDAKLNFAVV